MREKKTKLDGNCEAIEECRETKRSIHINHVLKTQVNHFGCVVNEKKNTNQTIECSCEIKQTHYKS